MNIVPKQLYSELIKF